MVNIYIFEIYSPRAFEWYIKCRILSKKKFYHVVNHVVLIWTMVKIILIQTGLVDFMLLFDLMPLNDFCWPRAKYHGSYNSFSYLKTFSTLNIFKLQFVFGWATIKCIPYSLFNEIPNVLCWPVTHQCWIVKLKDLPFRHYLF